jgi:hypothetical protein
MKIYDRIIMFFYLLFFLLSLVPISLSLLNMIPINNVERALLIIFGITNAFIYAELAFGKWKK